MKGIWITSINNDDLIGVKHDNWTKSNISSIIVYVPNTHQERVFGKHE